MATGIPSPKGNLQVTASRRAKGRLTRSLQGQMCGALFFDRLDGYRDFEAHRLRQLADLIIAYLKL